MTKINHLSKNERIWANGFWDIARPIFADVSKQNENRREKSYFMKNENYFIIHI